MDDHERRRQELLYELTRRFQESANTMKSIAKRISKANEIHNKNKHSYDQLCQPLASSASTVEEKNPAFSYLEFIEFTSEAEFNYFKKQNKVTSEDIKNIDWDNLSEQLLS